MSRATRTGGVAVALLLVFSACRPQPQTWPADEADLTGQILDARSARGLDGLSVSLSPVSAPAGSGDIQRLRVRVLGARTTTPGSDAIVGVDGTTSVTHSDRSNGDIGHRAALQGAYVRIWFRGTPRRVSPTELTAMARVVVIDSVVAR